MQLLVYGRAFNRGSAILPPQYSHRPYTPPAIRCSACSICPSSRLSISTSCEQISSFAQSTAASTLSPTAFNSENLRKMSRNPFTAYRREEGLKKRREIKLNNDNLRVI